MGREDLKGSPPSFHEAYRKPRGDNAQINSLTFIYIDVPSYARRSFSIDLRKLTLYLGEALHAHAGSRISVVQALAPSIQADSIVQEAHCTHRGIEVA